MAGDAGGASAAVGEAAVGGVIDAVDAAFGVAPLVPPAYDAVGGANSAPADAAGTDAADGGIAAADAMCGGFAPLCAAATVVGIVCEDGNGGAADRATSDVSSGALSFFHQANRGPDWQPTSMMAVSIITLVRKALKLMAECPFQPTPRGRS